MTSRRDERAEMIGRLLVYVVLFAVGYFLIKGVAFLYIRFGPWKATGILCVLILSSTIGISILSNNARSENTPMHPSDANVSKVREPTAAQYELNRKALESLPPAPDVSPAPPAIAGEPEVRVALPVNAAATPAPPQPQTYTVVGLEVGDTLNVRSGPGVKNPIVARLPNSYSGVELSGAAVTNGPTVWVPIKIGNIQGWVVRKNLYP